MRESWRCSAAMPAPHQLDKIQQRAVFFIMKRSEKMVRPKSSNRRTHAQSTYQSLPEQSTGRPASPGDAPAGMPSSAAPSGVLGELTARPTKLRRTEASAARSVPGSGELLAPNGTSIPFPFALHYDDLPPNRHVPHPQLRRADAHGPQGTTAQQPAFEDVVVHEQRRALDNRPSTSGRKRKGVIKGVTGSSDSSLPYRDDTSLIKRFSDGAKGEYSVNTVKIYSRLFEVFSAWLKQQDKGGLQDRLFKDELILDARKFQEQTGSTNMIAALKHLRSVESHGTVTISAQHRYVIPEGDKKLINDARSGISHQYLSRLRAFSAWLHAQGKKGLCETDRLYSQTLMDDAHAFSKTGMAGSNRSVLALDYLQAFYCAGATDIVEMRKRRKRRNIHEVDYQLSEQFKAAFSASGRDKKYAKGRSYGIILSERLMRFSAWLKENQKGPMASRLHDQTLDDDLKLFTYGQTPNHHKCMKGMLTQVRTMLPPDEQLPGLGSRAEPAEPSYSYMFPLTPEGGWPQAAEGVWIPDTPEQEVTGPAWPAQPAASSPPLEFDGGGALRQANVLLQGHQNLSQKHPSNWDLDDFSDQFMGHSLSAQPGASISNIPFDWQAMHPAATEPHHSTAMPQASILTLDENHTGLDWNDGERRVPE
ncbi:hypothetical protein ACDH50_14770 [Xanthomonas fragariae]|uniref:hypothetical protein n=2 Tax=Xanthomonas fragariae TaxID=48664 RepID=UPI001ABDE3D7|nr:hypothetical protein [Xanthomonas fragariae]